jgi:hypothetical protein
MGLDSFFGSGPAFFGTKSFSWKGDGIEPLLHCRDLRGCRFLQWALDSKALDIVSALSGVTSINGLLRKSYFLGQLTPSLTGLNL